MKKAIVVSMIWLATMVATFYAGREYQHLRTGFWYEVRDEEVHESAFGNATLTHATESVGMPYVDTGTSTIALEDHGIALYKSKRGFQESGPYVDKVTVDGNELKWRDAIFRYHLTISDNDE